MSRSSSRPPLPLRGGTVSETPGEVWESDDCVRRTVVMPIVLAERLAAQAERRGLSVSDLLVEYAEAGLGHDGSCGGSRDRGGEGQSLLLAMQLGPDDLAGPAGDGLPAPAIALGRDQHQAAPATVIGPGVRRRC